MTWADIKSFLELWFNYSGIRWDTLLLAIVLALFFGAFWLLLYRQPRSSAGWFLPIAALSAMFTVVAMAVITLWLDYYINEGLNNTWDMSTLNDWLLLAGLPTVLISALVQEGAKMVPMLAWWRGRKDLDPKVGLVIGATAGYGFGVFFSVYVFAYVLASGWDWGTVVQQGFLGILPFWQMFFIIAMNIATSALTGYGLARGLGWQFYLIAVGLNSLLNYSSLLYGKGYLTDTTIAIYTAAVAVLVTIAALWLRYRNENIVEPLPPVEPAPPSGPPEPPMQST